MEIYNLKDKTEFLKEVITLEYSEWATDFEKDKANRISNKIEKVKRLFQEENFCKLILVDDNKLIGFISIFPHDCDELPKLSPWYATMYVKKEYRGKRYSRLLNNAILEEARKRNIKTLYLKTDLKNYYEKFGAVFIKSINESENLFRFEL